MEREVLLSHIKNLKIWRKHDERAPHKPLLILYALSQLHNKQKSVLNYEEASTDLKQLLMDFGPPRKGYAPEQPFVRLKNDGIWRLNNPDIQWNQIKDNWLKMHHISGGFSDEVISLLKKDKSLTREIAHILLDEHFPESLHDEILEAVGLDLSYMTRKVKKRDPEFRERVLRAYGYKCAVCGFDIRLGHKLIGVEAAHIKWHTVGGPDIEPNGIALCTMHHKLFDSGVFTVDESLRLIISQNAHGSNGFNDWLMRYHTQKITFPIQKSYYPEPEYLNWHLREVFKGERLD